MRLNSRLHRRTARRTLNQSRPAALRSSAVQCGAVQHSSGRALSRPSSTCQEDGAGIPLQSVDVSAAPMPEWSAAPVRFSHRPLARPPARPGVWEAFVIAVNVWSLLVGPAGACRPDGAAKPNSSTTSAMRCRSPARPHARTHNSPDPENTAGPTLTLTPTPAPTPTPTATVHSSDRQLSDGAARHGTPARLYRTVCTVCAAL